MDFDDIFLTIAKIFAIILMVLVVCIIVLGIKASIQDTEYIKQYEAEIKVESKEDDRFEIIQEWTNNFVFYDKETKVQYYYIYDGVTVLLDKDGKPLLYEGGQV